MKNFMKKNITWGGYFKFCGIITLITVVMYAITLVIVFWDNIREWWNNHVSPKVTNVFSKKDDLEEDEG